MGNTEPSNTEPSGPERPAHPHPDSTVGLVNLWRVSGVAGEAPDTWLRLDVPEFQLWRASGIITGEWRASAGLFLATVFGASAQCVAVGTVPTVPWLESVTGHRATAAGWELTGATGERIATLTVDGAPTPVPAAADAYTAPPPVTADTRAALGRPVALPVGAVPATAADLTGRWVPVDLDARTHPFVHFDADGSWTGSDGCNGNAGRWAVSGSGAILATSGMSTMMFCEGAPVPSWVAQARLAVFDDGGLRLLAADGAQLGRLERG